MTPLSLVIVDDHQLFRDGLRALIESQIERAEIIGEASNGREAVQLVGRLKPEIVLMDVTMPELNGIEAVKHITTIVPECSVIGLSMHQSSEYVTQMLGAGAKGYIVKTAAFEELSQALDAVASGDVYLGAKVANTLVADYQRIRAGTATVQSTDEELSAREREVLRLVAEGNRTSDIAEKLSISKKTVETHRTHIMRKLTLSGVAAMTRYAVRQGLVEP